MGEKINILWFVSLLTIITYGQEGLEKDIKLKLRSVSLSFGVYYADFNEKSNDFDILEEGYHNGMSLIGNVSFSLKKHIFSLSLGFGSEFIILDGEPQSFYTLNLMYGKDFQLVKWFKIESHLGLGFYGHKREIDEFEFNEFDQTYRFLRNTYRHEVVLGIPVNVKFIFYPTRRFGIGMNPSVNFNSINITYTGNLIFQWKFNK